MAWEVSGSRPIYIQIGEIILTKILSGEFASGSKLPSVRELSAMAGVNPNTLQKALGDLEGRGIIITRSTSGKFITEDLDAILREKNQLANSYIAEYLRRMADLGFDRQEAERYFTENAQ